MDQFFIKVCFAFDNKLSNYEDQTKMGSILFKKHFKLYQMKNHCSDGRLFQI